MPLFCIHCALRWFVEHDGAFMPPSEMPSDSPEDHMRTHHPDPAATQAERRDLERRANAIMLRLNQKGRP